MLPNCKIVLKGLIQLSEGQDVELDLLGSDKETLIVRADDYPKYSRTYDYSEHKHEISSILDQLEKTGYLKYTYAPNSFVLTQKGLHPYAFRWEEFKEFLFKSIAVPIVVAFFTTLITLWLQSLL